MSCESREELRACEREMQELDNTKDQIMTLLKVGLANLGMWLRDHYFGESYQSCGWERMVPFFQLSGWVTATQAEVRLDFSPFNHRAMGRDLQDLCRNVNTSGVHLPDGGAWCSLWGNGGVDASMAHSRTRGESHSTYATWGKSFTP